MSTIFALSSGALPAAIAVFRMSGTRSLAALEEVSRRRNWRPREMRYTKLFTEKNELLDTAMAVYLPGPSTFTGEDTSEIYVHGSRAVANAMAHRLSSIEGLREAYRGEFTKRAFFNGKMDMAGVQGLRLLIESETDRQRCLSYGQMRGGEQIRRIRDSLSEALMRVFLLMDFGEHVETSLEEIHSLVAPLVAEVGQLAERSRQAELVHRGLRAVLVGRPNTGKSSIMNLLAEQDVAIVSPRAGTTRDSLEVRISVNGVPVSLTDTAGLRDSGDDLEQEGIRRSKLKVRDADLILLVVEAFHAQVETELLLNELQECRDTSVPVLVVRNKVDLASPAATPPQHAHLIDTVDTCALTPQGISSLVSALGSAVDNMVPQEAGPCLADHKLISCVHERLISAMSCGDAAMLCNQLEEAMSLLGQLAGDTVSEAILDKLFQQFCIGK